MVALGKRATLTISFGVWELGTEGELSKCHGNLRVSEKVNHNGGEAMS